MLPIPKFRSPALADIPLAVVFMGADFIRESIVKTAKSYLKLGGDPSLSWPDNTPLETVARDVMKAMESLIDRRICRDSVTGEMILSGLIRTEILYLDEGDYEGPAFSRNEVPLALRVEIPYWSMVEIGFLEGLFSANRKLYHFARNLLEHAGHTGLPATFQPDYFEMHEYVWDEMAEEDAGNRQIYERIKDETELFKKHFSPYTSRRRQKKKKLLGESRRIVRMLPNRQRRWARLLRNIIRSGEGAPKHCNFLDQALFYDEWTDLPAAFSVVWDVKSALAGEQEQYLNDLYGNYPSPFVVMKIGSASQIDQARRYIRYLSHVAKFFNEYAQVNMKEVWNL